jgi:hypothetical protein
MGIGYKTKRCSKKKVFSCPPSTPCENARRSRVVGFAVIQEFSRTRKKKKKKKKKNSIAFLRLFLNY